MANKQPTTSSMHTTYCILTLLAPFSKLSACTPRTGGEAGQDKHRTPEIQRQMVRHSPCNLLLGGTVVGLLVRCFFVSLGCTSMLPSMQRFTFAPFGLVISIGAATAARLCRAVQAPHSIWACSVLNRSLILVCVLPGRDFAIMFQRVPKRLGKSINNWMNVKHRKQHTVPN